MLVPIVISDHVQERRRRPRLRLAYSLRLYRFGEAFPIDTTTEDISCEGFFCFIDYPFSVGESLECELVISGPTMRADQDMVLRCRADVVRVVPQADHTFFGVGCQLSDYTFSKRTVESEVVVEHAR